MENSILLTNTDFNISINEAILDRFPPEVLISNLKKRDVSTDIGDVELKELCAELATRMKDMPSDVFKETIMPTIKEISTEQFGLFLMDRSNRTDVLCNFDEKELLTELYSRDSGFVFDCEDRQMTQIVRNVIRNEPPYEAVQEMLEYVKEHFEATELVDLEDMIRDMSDSEVIEMALDKAGCRAVLSAIAEII